MTRLAAPDVLIVGDAASIHVRRLAAGLRDAGRAVAVAAFDGDEIPGVRIHRLGRLGPTHDRRYPLGVPRLARIIRGQRPLVVNAHYLTSFGVMTEFATRLAHPVRRGPRVVQTTWGDDLLVTPIASALHRGLAAFALRGASLVTGDSSDLEAAARSLVPGIAWHRFVFGPPDRLLDAAAVKERRIMSTRLLIPAMRVDLVIRAFQAARSGAGADWSLEVVGAGAERRRLESLAAGDASIRFRGELPHQALLDRLLSATAVVSVPESDATSAGLLESLAAGAVPIVNDLPANREWVDSGIGEVVSRDPSIDELADAMRRAMMRTVSVASIRAAVSGHTWESELQRLVAKLDEIAAGGRR